MINIFDLINDSIIFLAVAWLFTTFIIKKYNWTFISATVFYCCLPLAKLAGFSVISAYFITFTMFIICIILRIKTNVKFTNLQIIYAACMTLAIIVMGIGWVTNGNPGLSGLASFAGAVQYFIAVLLLSYLIIHIRKENSENVRKGFYCAASIIITINVIFTVFQFVAYNAAVAVMRQLYISEAREGPIVTIETETSQFVRAFGSNYTPILLGLISLCIAGFILGDMLVYKKRSLFRAVLYFVSMICGLFALSRTIILGIFVLLICTAIITIYVAVVNTLKRKKSDIKESFVKLVAYILITVTSFAAVYGIGYAAGNVWYVEYYYKALLNPFLSLKSRYDGIIPNNVTPGTDKTNAEITVEEPGITYGAYEVFENNPVVGVGPEAVNNEFLGDSQFIILLHDGGILMFLLYTLFFGGTFVFCIIKKEYTRAIVLMAIGVGCLSVPSLYYACTIPFLGYCVSTRNPLEFKRKDKELKDFKTAQ